MEPSETRLETLTNKILSDYGIQKTPDHEKMFNDFANNLVSLLYINTSNSFIETDDNSEYWQRVSQGLNKYLSDKAMSIGIK